MSQGWLLGSGVAVNSWDLASGLAVPREIDACGDHDGHAFRGTNNLSVAQTGPSPPHCRVLLEAGLQRWVGRAGLWNMWDPSTSEASPG